MPGLKYKSKRNNWIVLFALWVVHGLIAIWQYYSYFPSINNLSIVRLLVGVTPVVWTGLSIYLIVLGAKKSFKIDEFLTSKMQDGVLITAALLFMLRFFLWYFGNLFSGESLSLLGSYQNVLSPILNLTACAALEIIFMIVFIYRRNDMDIGRFPRIPTVRFVVVFAALGLICAAISITGLGLEESYKGDWSRGLPAVPLLEWQIVLACVFCLGTVFFETRELKKVFHRIEFWICLGIWIGTVILWNSQPVVPNASMLQPHEPNFEIYPFIDSQTYDSFAQSALIGMGYGENRIPPRAIYIVFLTFVHTLVGQDYVNMIFVQSLLFAFLPVLLYLFSRDFFGRPIGISVAFLAAFRDYISNFVSPFTGNLSYSKAFLSEIPAAMLLILFLWIGFRWIRAGYPSILAFLMGGILSVAMLIRTQVVVALIVIVLFAILLHPKDIKRLAWSLIFTALAIALVISPWLWRNWQITGKIMFDSPEFQTINLALRYSRLNGLEPDVMPQLNESNYDYNARLKKMALDAISSNPSGAVWGIANSFFNHGVNNILLFPLREQIESFDEIWIPADAFWEKWAGTPTSLQAILLGIYIFLFGLGVAAAWIRNGWLGLLPLALNLAYNLWTSLALLSGQRFMMTMDWSIYLYYMIGIFALLGSFLYLLNGGRSTIVKWIDANPFLEILPDLNARPWHYISVGILFLGIGLSLPLTEKMFPERYPPLPQGQLLSELMVSPSLEQTSLDVACLQKLANENDLKFVQGRALYPRFYVAGDGESITDKVGYKPVNESRLVFELIGQANHRIIFPMSQSPEFFPHASDVILVYGQQGEVLWFIFVELNGKDAFYVSDTFDPSMCK